MKKCLSQEGLKLIACITMLIDHTGAILFPDLLWLRMIGRLAFPIFCFLLSQGLHYTKNKPKYLLRLTLWMIISEFAFDYAVFGGFTWSHQSVYVTLLLGALMGLCIEKLPKYLKILPVIPFALLASDLHTDYGDYGILLIALFIFTRDIPYKTLFQLAGLIVLNIATNQAAIQFYSILAIIPIFLYNSKKTFHSKALQWGFYAFYPVHLAILHLINTLFR